MQVSNREMRLPYYALGNRGGRRAKTQSRSILLRHVIEPNNDGKNMLPEIAEFIEYEIQYSMYYIEYPEDVPNGIWKDGAGERHYISEMGLDHLKASVQMVERDIKRLSQSGRPDDVIDVLMPKAKAVLTQLKVEFNRKAHV